MMFEWFRNAVGVLSDVASILEDAKTPLQQSLNSVQEIVVTVLLFFLFLYGVRNLWRDLNRPSSGPS